MRKSGQDTAYGTIAIECEAFLAGSLAEYRDDKGMEIPVWAYMNLLAHGTVRQIGECLVGPTRPGGLAAAGVSRGPTWLSRCST